MVGNEDASSRVFVLGWDKRMRPKVFDTLGYNRANLRNPPLSQLKVGTLLGLNSYPTTLLIVPWYRTLRAAVI